MYLNLKAKLCLPQHFRFSDENKSFVHIFLITLLGVEDGGQFDLEEELGVIVIENVNTELEKKNSSCQFVRDWQLGVKNRPGLRLLHMALCS